MVEHEHVLEHRSIAFYIKGGNNSRILVYAPDVQVTSVGDVSYVRSDVIRYQVTLECFGVANEKLVSLIQRADDDSVRTVEGNAPGTPGGAPATDTE